MSRKTEHEKGTFIVHIEHTENASWQGQVVWADENKTQSFRSTLELIKLIDSALSGEETTESGFDREQE